MFEPTGSQRDAASTLFDLPDYRVLSVAEEGDGIRRVEIESTDPPGCPVCGVLAGRVHSRRRQRLRDLPIAGPTEVVWVKRRWFCDQGRCPRGTFSEVTDQVPPFTRRSPASPRRWSPRSWSPAGRPARWPGPIGCPGGWWPPCSPPPRT